LTARFRALYVGALWVPLFAALLVTKIHKATILGGMTASGALAMLGADFVLLTALGAASYWGIAAPRALGRALLLVFHVVFPILLVLAFVEHVFFLVSGAVGDWYLLKDTVLRFAALSKLLGSQVTFLRGALLVSPIAWSAAVYGLGWRLRRRRERDAPAPAPAPVRTRRVALAVCAGFAVFGLVGLLLPISEDARPLKRNIYLGVSWEALGDALSSADLGNGVVGDATEAPRSPTSLAPTGRSSAKNLVLVVLESTGARHTGLHGERQTTPFLNQLGEGGAVVERAYTVFPHTSKALVGIHCGVHPAPVPGVPEATPGGMPVTCLPRLLREQGFATAFFQTAEENYERRSFLAEEFGYQDFVGKESIPARDFEESNYFGWEDDAMLQPALDWVDKQDGRFFLSILTLTSHHPYVIPKGFPATKYTDNQVLNDYLNTVRYSDRFVQRLYEGLERRGLAKDTVFVIVGDHGEAFGEHGRSQHTPVPYDEALHVPLLLAGPGVPTRRVEGLWQSVDIAPTAARLMGFEPRGGGFYGRDMLHDEPHQRLFFHCGYHEYCMGLITPREKLIYHFDRRRPELYDLANDPLERTDLYKNADPATTARVEAAIGKMRGIRAATQATYRNQVRRRLPRFVRSALPDDVGTPMNVRFGSFVHVRGLSVEPPRIEAGGKAVITTWYEVVEDPPDGWLTFHHLLGTSYRNADHVPVEGAYPVNRWEKGDVIEDRHVITTRPDAEPGSWDVTLGLWRKTPSGSERADAEVLAGDVRIRPDKRVIVGHLEITAPQLDPKKFVSQTAPPDTGVSVQFGDDFSLVNAGVERPDSKGGLKVTQEYVWRVLRKPATGRYEFLVDVEGRKRRRVVHRPLGGTWPVSSWSPGEYIRDPQGLISHTSDPLGDYVIWLTVKRDGVALAPAGEGLPIEGNRVRVGSYRLVR
jgi:lipoteichoic acid synthase